MIRAHRLRLIRAAREAGMSDAEILREIVVGEYGLNRRKQLIVEWGELLGLEASASLQLAFEAGLIPNVHPPPSERPRRTARGKSREQTSRHSPTDPQAFGR